MRKLKLALLVTGAVLVSAPLAWATFHAARGVDPWAVPWERRDLDCNGSVSIAEWYAAGLDYGWRPALNGPTGCWEVFSLKDGLPVTVWCAESTRCRPAVFPNALRSAGHERPPR
jgi:hypothetical protein